MLLTFEGTQNSKPFTENRTVRKRLASTPIRLPLTDDAVWQVTGTSLISSLTIRNQAQVVIPEGVVLTVGGTAYTDCVLTADSLT